MVGLFLWFCYKTIRAIKLMFSKMARCSVSKSVILPFRVAHVAGLLEGNAHLHLAPMTIER